MKKHSHVRAILMEQLQCQTIPRCLEEIRLRSVEASDMIARSGGGLEWGKQQERKCQL